jgi:hypothetical protein
LPSSSSRQIGVNPPVSSTERERERERKRKGEKKDFGDFWGGGETSSKVNLQLLLMILG